MRLFGMRAQQFEATRDFVVVGDPQVNTLKAKFRGAGGLSLQHVLDGERRAVINVGVVQILDARQPECRLQQAAKGPHETQLDHLVEKAHVLDGVIGVVVQRDCIAELLRRMRAAAVSVVLDDPAIRCWHGVVFPVSLPGRAARFQVIPILGDCFTLERLADVAQRAVDGPGYMLPSKGSFHPWESIATSRVRLFPCRRS